jgi:hypothetical protein
VSACRRIGAGNDVVDTVASVRERHQRNSIARRSRRRKIGVDGQEIVEEAVATGWRWHSATP